MYIIRYPSPLGGITLASDGESITGLWFDGQKHFGAGLPEKNETADLPVFQQAIRWLNLYFQGEDPGSTPPLHTAGTPFQEAVWGILQTIPRGRTMTYGEIARRIVKENGLTAASPRAVGGAVGRNPISLMIPCHRVVGADGSLTGYAGGPDKKRALLAGEGVELPR